MPRTGLARRRTAELARPPFGREHDRRRLTAMLTDDRPGVVTVTGPGGIGKSALVAAVRDGLHRMLGDDLSVTAPFEQTGTVGDRLAAGLHGNPPPLRHRAIPRQHVPSTRHHRLLIVDPADDHAAAIEDLRAGLPPHSRILACAVRPLGIPGERILSIGPLPTVDPDDEPDVIAGNPGVRLFCAAAPTAEGDPTDDDLTAIATVCQLLGGWPLAIEHVAGLTRLLGPGALADLLQSQPELAFEPVASPTDATRLLPSLRAAFDRTWRRLTTPERAMLRAATVFTGAFDARQAAAVAAAPVAEAVRTLAALMGMSLVQHAPGHPGRFTIAPPVRQYARWSFGRSAPERPVRQRHIDLVASTARASALASNSGDELTAMRTLGEVEAELGAVLDQLLATGAIQDALQLAADLAPGLVHSGEFDTVTDRLDALLRRTDVTDGPALAGALVGYADIVFTGMHGADRHELAAARLHRGLQMTRAGSDPHARLRALSVMIRAWPVMRDPRLVASCVREGASLARAIGSPGWLARFEAWSGMLAHQTGDLDSAIRLGSAALARGRRCGDLRARLLAGMLLHTVPEPPADIPGGLPGLDKLLHLAEELHEPRLASIVLAYLSSASLSDGRPADAAYWSARALEVGGGLDTPFGAGFAIMFLVGVAQARGEAAQAATLHGMVGDRLDEFTAELPPWVAADYATLVDRLRRSLGVAGFNARAGIGAALPWRDATATALAYAYRVSDRDRAAAGGDRAAADTGTIPPGSGTIPPGSGTIRPGSGTVRPSGGIAVPATATGPEPIAPPGTAGQVGPARAATLTPREQQVLALIAEGRETRTIAEHLQVSMHAVAHHTSSILGKLGVQNRTQAAIWAVHRQYRQHADRS